LAPVVITAVVYGLANLTNYKLAAWIWRPVAV